MRRYMQVFGIVLAVLVGRAAAPQTPAGGDPDPGVRPTRLIDRDEVRVTRVEIQAGATRRVHTHDDVVYHLWIPVEGRLELTSGSAAPVVAASGQAFFFNRGTPHSFKNVGTTPAAVLEIFVKQATKTADRDPSGAVALKLAARAMAPTRPDETRIVTRAR